MFLPADFDPALCSGQFETPLPPLQPAVFPPALHEPPPPALELFDLDEAFAGQAVRLASLTNKVRAPRWTRAACSLAAWFHKCMLGYRFVWGPARALPSRCAEHAFAFNNSRLLTSGAFELFSFQAKRCPQLQAHSVSHLAVSGGYGGRLAFLCNRRVSDLRRNTQGKTCERKDTFTCPFISGSMLEMLHVFASDM